MDEIDKKLKEIQREKEKLEALTRDLHVQQAHEEEMNSKIDKLFTEGMFDDPKSLADALMKKYDLKMDTEKTRKRRKRTTVTAELRDQIVDALKSGVSKNAAAKEFGLSYAVVVKIADGTYNHLRPRQMKKTAAA